MGRGLGGAIKKKLSKTKQFWVRLVMSELDIAKRIYGGAITHNSAQVTVAMK